MRKENDLIYESQAVERVDHIDPGLAGRWNPESSSEDSAFEQIEVEAVEEDVDLDIRERASNKSGSMVQ